VRDGGTAAEFVPKNKQEKSIRRVIRVYDDSMNEVEVNFMTHTHISGNALRKPMPIIRFCCRLSV
jgi:hypothetical protein